MISCMNLLVHKEICRAIINLFVVDSRFDELTLKRHHQRQQLKCMDGNNSVILCGHSELDDLTLLIRSSLTTNSSASEYFIILKFVTVANIGMLYAKKCVFFNST